MTRDLRFQVMVVPNAPWDELATRFKTVEALGFDMATTGDHFVDWNAPDRPWLEAWTLLAAVARETSSLRLGTYVTQIPFRNPALLARQALTVDQLSGGRLEVGLGTGLLTDPAYQMMGMPNWTARERVDRLEEYVQVVDLLLSNEVSSFTGSYYSISDAAMNPRPIQRPRPPLVVAALAPRMLGIAAKYADTWNTMSFMQSFDEQLKETQSRIATVTRICAETGRDPKSLRWSYSMFDPQSRASDGAITYYESEDEFLRIARPVIELGFSELGLYYPAVEEQLPMFEKIALEVLPELRREYERSA